MAANQTIEKTVIKKTPDVCGGDACIGNRRISVWVIIAYEKLGRDDEGLMKMFDPPISWADLEAAREYYQQNRDEIDEAIQDNETGEDDAD